MKLYKFRPLANLERLLDIVLHERLYCSPFDLLNDPMEGVYISKHLIPSWPPNSNSVEIIKKKNAAHLHDAQKLSRICSLSASFSDLRLWAYYADGHNGVAVEIDFNGHEADVYRVDYVESLPQYADHTILGTPFADQVLTKKTHHWNYEDEQRILQSDPYYSIEGRVISVLLGSRVDESSKRLLRKAFGERVPLLETDINENTLGVESQSKD